MDGTEYDLKRVGRFVERARKTHYATVSAAHQAAHVNRETWQRAERGDKIRPDKVAAIEKALGWDPGDFERIAAGGEPFGSGGPTGGLAGTSDEDLLAELRRRLARSQFGTSDDEMAGVKPSPQRPHPSPQPSTEADQSDARDETG